MLLGRAGLAETAPNSRAVRWVTHGLKVLVLVLVSLISFIYLF